MSQNVGPERESAFVYKITNLVNGKIYIGKWMGSKRVTDRWKEHVRAAGNGFQSHLYNAMRKHGVEAFKIEVIDQARTSEELIDKEKFHILQRQSFNPKIGYNMTMGGDGGCGMLGRRHSEATKLKISIRNKGNKFCEGRVLSKETKEKMRQKALGRSVSKEARRKIGIASAKRRHSVQTKQQMSLSARKRFQRVG